MDFCKSRIGFSEAAIWIVALLCIGSLLGAESLFGARKSQSIETLSVSLARTARTIGNRCDFEIVNEAAALTLAAVAIESQARNWIESIIETALLEAARHSNLSLPNFSYGIAQLKPTAIQKALPNRHLSHKEIAKLLLDDCSSLSAASIILDRETRICENNGGKNSDCSLEALAVYNGQKSRNFSNHTYLAVAVRVVRRLNSDY